MKQLTRVIENHLIISFDSRSFIIPGLCFFSMPAVEYSKSFITSVVVGKDVVPRIGLHQMEALRADLINAIKRSVDPKVIQFLHGLFQKQYKQIVKIPISL